MKSRYVSGIVLAVLVGLLAGFALPARTLFLTESAAAATPTPTPNSLAPTTATPTATPTPSPSRTPTATTTRTATPQSTLTPTAGTQTPSPTATPAATASGALPLGLLNTTVLIANLDAVPASARLRVFNLSGAEVYNTTRTIAANGLVLVTLPASLGAGFIGSATVSSLQKVYPLVLNANLSNSAREIYETSKAPQTSLSFPIFRHLGNDAQKSVIAIQNADPSSPAAVTFHYYAASGSEGAGSPLAAVTIPPLASHYFDSQTLFGTTTVSYTVRVDSTVKIAGAERVQYIQDTAAMPALTAADGGTESYLNWIEREVNGSGVADSWSEIYVRNGGSAATNVTIRYYNPDGSLQDSQTKTIAANGFEFFDTRLDSVLGSAFKGYARVTQNKSEPLGVQWLEASGAGARLSGFSGLPSNRYAAKWACADARRFDTDPSQYTNFRIVNVDAASANVTINLYDPANGALKASTSQTVAPGNQLSVNLKAAIYDVLGSSYAGLALVQSTNGKLLVTDAFTSYDALGQTGFNCAPLP